MVADKEMADLIADLDDETELVWNTQIGVREMLFNSSALPTGGRFPTIRLRKGLAAGSIEIVLTLHDLGQLAPYVRTPVTAPERIRRSQTQSGRNADTSLDDGGNCKFCGGHRDR